ncbi:probable serine/threonine-protein kinase DDB_G0288147 isoform X2 [Maniola hyperantus]|uniref:probable serine/threonine-protein kinase DDB_G0288147 isoform X2 n=1 Tax=Aphantopus hyperantus TaxID=2795564 RepID=UPI002125F7F3
MLNHRTALNTQDDFQRIPIASPNKRKHNKSKKKQNDTTISPTKNGDIRVLFSKEIKATKSYTNLIKHLDLENDIPTRTINVINEILLAHRNIKKICYFCQYSLFNNYCYILQQRKSRNTFSLAGWLDETSNLPDIDLINEFDSELLLQYATSMSESNFISGNENTTQKHEKENERAKHFDLQFEPNFLTECNLSEIDKVISVNYEDNVEVNADIGDTHDIQFDVVQENDNDPKELKNTLEYFGLSCIEDLFTGSDNEGAGYESDSSVIFSPYHPTKNVESIYVSDSESNLGVNSDTCNDRKLLRKRHNESDDEGPVYKSKKIGNKERKINISTSASNSTSTSHHSVNTNKDKDVEKIIRAVDNFKHKIDMRYRDVNNECDDKGAVYESDMILSMNKPIKIGTSIIISDSDSDSENNIDMCSNGKSLKKPHNESNGEGLMYKSANKQIKENISSNSNSIDMNTNKLEVVEAGIAISEINRYFYNNTHVSTNVELLKERNNETDNEGQKIKSANKEMTISIASFTSNSTTNLSNHDSENDVQVIETNVSSVTISDTDE